MTSTNHKKIKGCGSFRTASTVMAMLMTITLFAAGCEKPAKDSSGEYATASDLPASPAVSASAAASASASAEAGTSTGAGQEDNDSDVEPGKDELKIDSVTFLGRIDSGSIEARVSGVQPDENAIRVYRLSDSIRDTFDGDDFKEGDILKIGYLPDEATGQSVIYSAEKISAPQPRDEFAAIPVHVEGEIEYRQAKLHYSDNMSYSLYVLDYFTYSAEEPGKDIVMSNYDGEYFVRIERLAPDLNIEEFKNGLKKAYGDMGNVIERNPAELYFEEFRDAKFWLHVDVLNENGSVKTTLQYLMKEISGNNYGFFFHMPAKEASEGLTPSMWAIVLTLK